MRCLSHLVILCLTVLSCTDVTNVHADQPTAVISFNGERRLDLYAVDPKGKMTTGSRTAVTSKPGPTCFDAIGQNLYVGGSDPSTISVFRFQNDELTFLQSVAVPDRPSFLRITPSGQFLLACYYSTGQVTVHRIVGEGRLSEEPLQTLDVDPQPHCIMTEPSGQFAFVPHTSVSRISQFRFNEDSGTLTPNTVSTLQRDEGVAPRHLWFHPKGEYAFGSNEKDCSVSVYAFDEQTGLLAETQTVSSMNAKPEGRASTSHIEAHPSGKYVYVANRQVGSIAAFSFKTRRGELSLLQHAKTPPVVRSFAISPDGKFLLAAGQKTNQLTCYRIDEDGRLAESDSQSGGKTPWWVTFSPIAGRDKSTLPRIDFASLDRSLCLGQGTMVGEVSDTTAFVQTRLTLGNELDRTGDLPGSSGVVRFEWSLDQDFNAPQTTSLLTAQPDRDFIIRSKLSDLRPNQTYYYRARFGSSPDNLQPGPTCSFRTLPGPTSESDVRFIVGSCMNYIKFMHGRVGKASGPITATDEDKRLGFPVFATMSKMKPEFFIGTGDIVYYDNPFRVARTKSQLRKCWHEQFRFPRMVDFFQRVPAYWSKDDHDFRFNDSDNESSKRPLPQTGISMFREQLPIAAAGDTTTPNYRTFRVSKHLQVWLTEGRDYRSANRLPDGPDKTMWGRQQRDWLKSTLAASDAKWKLMINPTPMVGPDDAYKKDNHANLKGFRREGDEFFDWVKNHNLENLFLVCGDRHWQYHSIHPLGVNEFACGALNDENSRMGVSPGDRVGTDPDATVNQLFTSPEPSGGFLQIKAGERLQMTHFNDEGQTLYQVSFP